MFFIRLWFQFSCHSVFFRTPRLQNNSSPSNLSPVGQLHPAWTRCGRYIWLTWSRSSSSRETSSAPAPSSPGWTRPVPSRRAPCAPGSSSEPPGCTHNQRSSLVIFKTKVLSLESTPVQFIKVLVLVSSTSQMSWPWYRNLSSKISRPTDKLSVLVLL